MKKFLALLIAVIMCFTLVACNVNDNTGNNDDDDDDKKETETETGGKEASEDLEIIEAIFEMGGTKGECVVCEEDCDEDAFLCDDCMNTDVCLGCDEAELGAEGDLLCDDCAAMLQGMIDGEDTPVNSYEDYYEYNDYYEDYYGY